MKTTKYSPRDNRVLTEIYRCLNYYHEGDLYTVNMLLDLPSEVKSLKNKNIIITSGAPEVARALNWYKLTPKGRKLFCNYIREVSEEENILIFEGRKVINFNNSLKNQ